MKKLVVLAIMVALVFCLVSGTAFARGGGHHGRGHGGGGYHGGGHFWGAVVVGSIAGAIVAPMLYTQPVYVHTQPVCSNRVIRPGYFAYDSYGNRMRIRAEVVRECY